MKNTNLHNIESSGFKTPNDYFESFEADFFEHLKEKKPLRLQKRQVLPFLKIILILLKAKF
ncbi:hypothetical protein [Winogradskyella sp. PC D3.3]